MLHTRQQLLQSSEHVLNMLDSLWISEALLCGVVTSEGCGAGAEGGVAADVSGVALLPEHH